MADEAHVFAALGDPTRRGVLDALRHGELSVAELTARLPVSQSAVSQHLRVLKGAGLVTERPVGARRLYRVDRDGLDAVRAYVDSFWDEILGAFADFAQADSAPSPDVFKGPSAPDRTEGPPAPGSLSKARGGPS